MNNIRRFTAQNAEQALEEVHNALGPDAVIVNIRKAPKGGINGLFQSPQVEVSALLPAAQRVTTRQPQPEVPLKKAPQNGQPELPTQGALEAGLGSHLNLLEDTPIEIPKPSSPDEDKIVPISPQVESTEPWRAEQVLESIGILPLCIERLTCMAKRRFPQFEDASVSDQLAHIRFCLLDLWGGLYAEAKKGTRSRKLLVGPPGCGKTTALCKWMTQAVLAKREPARVWRLDGHLPNMAEMLTVHAEMLDVPVARVWKVEEYVDSTTQFIDLPGVTPSDAEGMKSLVTLANGIQPAECLLVLNSAYELNHLVGLVRSFSDIPINGLIMTHLDEETRWSKLWNLSLAVDMPILFCTGGQEMPGDFLETTPDDLFRAVMKHIKPHATQQTETATLKRFTIK